MESIVPVHVTAMNGAELHFEMNMDQQVENVRLIVAEKMQVVPHALLFCDATGIVPYMKHLHELQRDEDGELRINVIEVDPMLDLGKFDSLPHGNDIELTHEAGPQGEHTSLKKIADARDSNNVFLLGNIVRPCFIEFKVVRTRDEMSFGVTYDISTVQKTSGFGNLGLKSTWLISKRKSMPVLLFGGARPSPPDEFQYGFADEDRVMVIADPEERQVRFYRNDVLVADNLPDYPLPEFHPDGPPLRIYCMVDLCGDEVRVARWGPAESLTAYAKA